MTEMRTVETLNGYLKNWLTWTPETVKRKGKKNESHDQFTHPSFEVLCISLQSSLVQYVKFFSLNP